jgi:hypothetical protein
MGFQPKISPLRDGLIGTLVERDQPWWLENLLTAYRNVLGIRFPKGQSLIIAITQRRDTEAHESSFDTGFHELTFK